MLQPGDIRVETDPNSDTTLVTVLSGQVQVDGNGIQMALEQGQSVQLRGSQPVAAQWMQVEPQDAFDAFSAERDAQYVNAINAQNNDVNPETIGADDLAQNGQWQNDVDNGPVWYPTAVAVDWEPYRNGHWIWVAPWGWTWVEAERWGFAPFHYGRWGRFGNRWGWVPGPPVVRPIWSPALVVFVGAPGVTAWFPLGPREPFVPWYHASTLYVNRVNVSNIFNRNAAQVRSGYNQRTTNLFPGDPGSRNYVNRKIATVAMNQGDFAAGRPVAKNYLHGSQPQLANAPVVPHPLVTPERTSVVTAPARAVPPRTARPTLASRQDTRVTAPPQPRQRRRPSRSGAYSADTDESCARHASPITSCSAAESDSRAAAGDDESASAAANRSSSGAEPDTRTAAGPDESTASATARTAAHAHAANAGAGAKSSAAAAACAPTTTSASAVQQGGSAGASAGL